MNGGDKKWLEEFLKAEHKLLRQEIENVRLQLSNRNSRLLDLYEETLKPQIEKNTKYIESDRKFKYIIYGITTSVGIAIGGFWNKIFTGGN